MKTLEEKFEENYLEKGGLKKLTEMVSENKTYKEIKEHFGVSRNAVRVWIDKFFGLQYDTRRIRREQRVNQMLEFMKTHTEEESRLAFRKSNTEYFREALFLAYQQEIYKK